MLTYPTAYILGFVTLFGVSYVLWRINRLGTK